MKIYIAVLCIVLLQGVFETAQASRLDSAVSAINSVYRQYRSGTLVRNILQKVRECVSKAIAKLTQLQTFIESIKLPSLPSLPSPPSLPSFPKVPQPQSFGRWPQWSN